MTAPDAFARAMEIAGCFERARVEYAIGGALALGIWGVPRGTVDVDVNVFVERDGVRAVAAHLRSIGVSIGDDRAVADSDARGMFIGDWDGMRIDVFTPSIEFSREAFRTRVRRNVSSIDAWYLSAESVAVFKLLFFRLKDLADLERLVAVTDVDAAYVRGWIVSMMGVDDPRVAKWDEIVAAYVHTA